jgi:hypothetical protein
MDFTVKSRWYCLALDRFMAILLPVECLLWLWEHFQGFAFYQHTGFLSATTFLDVAFLLLLVRCVVGLLSRCGFLFHSRTPLVFVILVRNQANLPRCA